jgi:hypothetical protein
MTFLERTGGFVRDFAARFAARRDNGPIDSLAELERFVASRSAFVAQHKLYGYIKTRMGTRYPSMFEDDVFIQSVNIAKMHVFAACLSDMTVHAVATATAGSSLTADERTEIARRCYTAAIDDNRDHAPDGAEAKWRKAFEKRLGDIHWENMAAGGNAFSESPKALFRWAPIADELKRYDGEIIKNSVVFAWAEHIRALRQRLAPEAVVEDWRARGGA